MVLHLRTGEDAICDDLIDLLGETVSQVGEGGSIEILEHHYGLGLRRRRVGVLEDGIIGQMDFFVQFGESKLFI